MSADDIATVRYYLNIVAEEDSLAEAHAALSRLVEQLEVAQREITRLKFALAHEREVRNPARNPDA